MKNTNDIMQQLKHGHDQRNYSGRIKEATQALQQAIQAINKIIGDITREETFVEQIHNQITVEYFMNTIMSTIHTELQSCVAHLDFTCPSHLDLLAAKQKALQGIYQSITDIQELLARHSDLYGICNYEENYRIYQILHAFFKQIENDCLTLATYDTEADVKAWLETQPATHRQFITALQKIGKSFIDRHAAREPFATLRNAASDVTPMVSTPTATPLTTSTSQVPTAESTAVEPQSVLTGDMLSTTANLLSTADPALNTGLEFFTALPKELLLEIAKHLDAKSLWALALTGKTQAELLLTMAALPKLQSVIEGIKSLPTLYELFVQVTQAKTSALRLQYKNRLPTYEDTDSYRLAIQALAEKALTFQSACNSFDQYTLLQTMLQEAFYFKAPGRDWKECLMKLKPAALKQLLQDIQQATDLDQLLELFQALKAPTNLLRFNAVHIIHKYGDTAEFKTALFQLGQQMEKEKYTFTKQALPQLNLLLAYLRGVKPSVNSVKVEWQNTIEKLENKLRAFHETIGVAQAAALPSTRAAKP